MSLLMTSVSIWFPLQLICVSVLGAQDTKIYIRGVQCNASEKFIFKNYSCFAKSYSRTISTINVVATAKIPLDQLFVSWQSNFSVFRSVLSLRCLRNFSTSTGWSTDKWWKLLWSTFAELWKRTKIIYSWSILLWFLTLLHQDWFTNALTR